MSSRNQRAVKRTSGLSFGYAKTSLAIDFDNASFVVQLPKVHHVYTRGLAPVAPCPDMPAAVTVIHRRRRLSV